MTDKIVVFSACASADEAARIARGLVEKRLAACVNVLPGVRSIYRWQGVVEDEAEVLLVIKSAGGFSTNCASSWNECIPTKSRRLSRYRLWKGRNLTWRGWIANWPPGWTHDRAADARPLLGDLLRRHSGDSFLHQPSCDFTGGSGNLSRSALHRCPDGQDFRSFRALLRVVRSAERLAGGLDRPSQGAAADCAVVVGVHRDYGRHVEFRVDVGGSFFLRRGRSRRISEPHEGVHHVASETGTRAGAGHHVDLCSLGRRVYLRCWWCGCCTL